MSGWFAMNRAMFDHPIFAGKPERVAAWAWIIAKAAWKDTRQDANGKIVTVQRGQLLTSYRQMSKATGVSVKALRILIERLQDGNAVGIETGTGRLMITIRNYEKYQSADTPKGTGRAQEGHSEGTQKKQDNKITTKEEEEPKGSLSSGDDLSGPRPFDEITEAVKAYNDSADASGWPQLRILSKQRRASLKARLKECGGLDGWHSALERARGSPHLCGQNDRGWTANFDFLTRQSSFAKLMEGNYDPRIAGTAHSITQNSRGVAGSATAAEIADRGARWAESRAARR